MKIKNFYGKESEELKYDKNFEQNCIVMAQHSNKPIKDLTVKEYFALIQHVNDKNKKQTTGRKK